MEAKKESERAQLEAERAARKELKKKRMPKAKDPYEVQPAEESSSSGDEPLAKRRQPRTPASSVDRGSSQPRGRDSQAGAKQSGLGALQRHLRE